MSYKVLFSYDGTNADSDWKLYCKISGSKRKEQKNVEKKESETVGSKVGFCGK